MKKIGVVRFLGTNCDRDIWQAVEGVGARPQWLWYEDRFEFSDLAGIVVPGGFSYGDYLRAGALAAKSPVMESIREAAEGGVPILGICNGFQILCESGLLPGALVQNENLRFIDRWEGLTLENANPHWGSGLKSGARIDLPIAHGEGRFYLQPDELKKVEDSEQVWWRYQANPNGSLGDVAGIMNKEKNVAGLMPHPERALFDWMGGVQGLSFFQSMVS